MNLTKSESSVPILVTGAAGFLGMHLSMRLLSMGFRVVGVDEINDYYDTALKFARLKMLSESPNFAFHRLDVSDSEALSAVFREFGFRHVIHLAAQAGVRYSLKNPFAYERSNLAGMTAVLEASRNFGIQHLLYASSSSVYGSNTKVPFSETDPVVDPVSFYAATKRSNELMAIVYSKMFKIPMTGLRFFTVYGPWGRPDMAYWSFTENILKKLPIDVYGNGLLSRDFTYCDDVVDAIAKLLAVPPEAPSYHRLLNVGNSKPNTVNQLIEAVEAATNEKAIRVNKEQPQGDVERTFADSSALEILTGFKPATKLNEGISKFVSWYRDYYKI